MITSSFAVMPVKEYELDLDKINNIEDIKSILKSMHITWYSNAGLTSIDLINSGYLKEKNNNAH